MHVECSDEQRSARAARPVVPEVRQDRRRASATPLSRVWRWTAAASLAVFGSYAAAHEDRIFSVSADGQVVGIAEPWGPVTVTVQYSRPGTVSSVLVEGRRFRRHLAPCMLEHLTQVIRVEAPGSWWHHDRSEMPAYLSLVFVQREPSAPELQGEFDSVTLSLEDGTVLMGQRTYDPWWGPVQVVPVWDADKCSSWR